MEEEVSPIAQVVNHLMGTSQSSSHDLRQIREDSQ